MFRRVVADSWVVRHARQQVAGSRVAAAVSAVLRPTPAPGLRWTAQQEAQSVDQLRQVVHDSSIVATVSRGIMAAGAAWQDARFTAWLRRTRGDDVASRARAGGVALVAAVLTHSVWFAAFGIDVSVLGWCLRAALAVLGAAAAWRPEALADAANDRARRAD